MKGGGIRVEYSDKDDENLLKYIATYNPGLGGRKGQALYKRLEQNVDGKWPWAERHPWQSWRERYMNNETWFNSKIKNYQRQKGIEVGVNGDVKRTRADFSEEDDAYLVQFLAVYSGEHMQGRRGNKVYIVMTEDEDGLWPWAKRHPAQSWRNRYVKNSDTFDAKIEAYRREHNITEPQPLRNPTGKKPKPVQEEEPVEAVPDPIEEAEKHRREEQLALKRKAVLEKTLGRDHKRRRVDSLEGSPHPEEHSENHRTELYADMIDQKLLPPPSVMPDRVPDSLIDPQLLEEPGRIPENLEASTSAPRHTRPGGHKKPTSRIPLKPKQSKHTEDPFATPSPRPSPPPSVSQAPLNIVSRAPVQLVQKGFRKVWSKSVSVRPSLGREAEESEEEEKEEEEGKSGQEKSWPPVRKSRASLTVIDPERVDRDTPGPHVEEMPPPPSSPGTSPAPTGAETRDKRVDPREEEEQEEEAPATMVTAKTPRDPLMTQFVERLSKEYDVDPLLTWKYLDQTQSLAETERLLKAAQLQAQTRVEEVSAPAIGRSISGRDAVEVEQALLQASTSSMSRVQLDESEEEEESEEEDEDATLAVPLKPRTSTPLKIRLGVREQPTDEVDFEHSRAAEYNRLSKAGRVDEFWKREKRRKRPSTGTHMPSPASTPFSSPTKREVVTPEVDEDVAGYVRAVRGKAVEDVMKYGRDIGRRAVFEQTMRLVDLHCASHSSV